MLSSGNPANYNLQSEASGPPRANYLANQGPDVGLLMRGQGSWRPSHWSNGARGPVIKTLSPGTCLDLEICISRSSQHTPEDIILSSFKNIGEEGRGGFGVRGIFIAEGYVSLNYDMGGGGGSRISWGI